MFTGLVLLVVGCSHLSNGELYVDPTVPYTSGELEVLDRIITPTTSPLNPPPMHTRVFYPNTENLPASTTFGVYYFITGFGGFMPPHQFADYLARVASHGYVVLGSWPLITGEGLPGIDFSADAHIVNMAWLEENLPASIRQIADFDNMGIGCHSHGCEHTFELARMDPSKYKTLLNLEPVSTITNGGVNFQMPSIMLGAELANMSCSIPGMDFETFYSRWKCPKIMFEVANVGHCGFLDERHWELCRDIPLFCKVEDPEILPAYRMVVEGLSAAMLNTYIQGSDRLEYVTNPALIPLPLLQHHTDMDC